MRKWLLAVTAAGVMGAVAAGCAEGGTGNATAGTGAAPTGTGTGAGGASSTTTTGDGASSTSSTSSGGPAGEPVLNEISAKDEDWIEIANPGSSPIDLGDYGLCDDVDPAEGHECDMDTIVRFPKGTTIPAGGYVVVVGDKDAADGVGPHVDCLKSGGPTTCFYASWKVSASNGEQLHLLDPKDDTVDEVEYPKDGVGDGETWGRLPDGTGSFAATAPTPGAANKAP
ncbi:Hypothetical protein A7982_00112 [Minicystis rosea]|nr:Hypothetical protein A7982_00112 [Minicystis rosea]